MRHVKPLITLALACLLAVPALAIPMDGNAGPGDMLGQMSLTEEEKATTTLGELKDLVKDQKNQPGLNGANCNMNHFMGPQGNMPGMASADGCNMMGAQAPQGTRGNMPGMNNGANCNMMGAQAPQGTQGNMPGMNNGANCNMMGANAPQGSMFGMAGACPQQQGMNAPGSGAQGPKM